MGFNYPKEHQAIITQLIHGLADLYIKDKTHLFPYPETMIDEGQTGPAPDILLYDHQDRTVALIEVTHSSGVKKDCAKVLLRDYDVQEGFVYDYKKTPGINLTSYPENLPSLHLAKCFNCT